jgi:hypothetical protein
MNKLMITLAVTAALAAGDLTVFSAPAAAQAGKYTITVYGNDPCPAEAICIRKGESERYRLPKDQQLKGTRQENTSWAQKSKVLTTVGDTGTGSCSAVGPGGHTGCLVQQINQAKQQARQQAEDNQPPE